MDIGQCEYCGKDFYFYPSAKKRGGAKFCSKDCAQKAVASLVEKECPQCRKTFSYNLSWPRIYCSKTCAAQAHAEEKRTQIEVVCEICGNSFMRIPSQVEKVNHLFCSMKCFGIYQSKIQKGKKPPFAGMKFPERTAKGTVLLICTQCGKEHRKKKSQAERHEKSFCSKSCEATWLSANQRGENSPSWKGGYESYYGENWPSQRRNARRRDNYTCQRCGLEESEHYRELDVHHIIPFREFGIKKYKKANQLSNLITLCNTCHVVVEHEQGTRPNPKH